MAQAQVGAYTGGEPCNGLIPLALCDPTLAAGAKTAYQDYLTDSAPAYIAHVAATAQAQTDRRVGARQAQKNRDDALAAANTSFVNGLATPIANEANGSISADSQFATDSVENGNLLSTATTNGAHRLAHTDSDSQLGVQLATALKTYLVGLASLPEDAMTDPVKKAYDDARADATRDDQIREANADYARAIDQIAAAHTLAIDVARVTKELNQSHASLAKTFTTQAAPKIAQWNNHRASAEAGQRSGATTAENNFQLAKTSASGGYRSADNTSRRTALEQMNSSTPSPFLNAQVNLASQRESWWNAQQASELSSVTNKNSALATFTNATNTAFLAREAAINTAGVTYANTASSHFKTFQFEIAQHAETYRTSLAGAAKVFADTMAAAKRDLAIALANAERDLAVHDDQGTYSQAVLTANSAFASVVEPASESYENAKKLAQETRNQSDATSRKVWNQALAQAVQVYKQAVSSANTASTQAKASAFATRDAEIAAADTAFASSSASSWTSQLANPANGTPDPWFDQALAEAQAADQLASAMAAATTNRSLADNTANTDLVLATSTASDLRTQTREAATESYQTSTAAATAQLEEVTGVQNGNAEEGVEASGTSGVFFAPVWLLLWWPWDLGDEGEDIDFDGPLFAEEPFDPEFYGLDEIRQRRQEFSKRLGRLQPWGIQQMVEDLTNSALALAEYGVRRAATTSPSSKLRQDIGLLGGWASGTSLPHLGQSPIHSQHLTAHQEALARWLIENGYDPRLGYESAEVLDTIAMEILTAGIAKGFGTVAQSLKSARSLARGAGGAAADAFENVFKQSDEVTKKLDDLVPILDNTGPGAGGAVRKLDNLTDAQRAALQRNTVIGKQQNIRPGNLRSGDQALLTHRGMDWPTNRARLQSVIDEGRPIRDLDILDDSFGLGNEHRHLLDAGWERVHFDGNDFWVPPTFFN